MAEPKTKPTEVAVRDHLAAIEDAPTTHGGIVSDHDPVRVRLRLARQVERGDPATRVSVFPGDGGRVRTTLWTVVPAAAEVAK